MEWTPGDNLKRSSESCKWFQALKCLDVTRVWGYTFILPQFKLFCVLSDYDLTFSFTFPDYFLILFLCFFLSHVWITNSVIFSLWPGLRIMWRGILAICYHGKQNKISWYFWDCNQLKRTLNIHPKVLRCFFNTFTHSTIWAYNENVNSIIATFIHIDIKRTIKLQRANHLLRCIFYTTPMEITWNTRCLDIPMKQPQVFYNLHFTQVGVRSVEQIMHRSGAADGFEKKSAHLISFPFSISSIVFCKLLRWEQSANPNHTYRR